MKGMVFTEFLEMVEERFGEETADTILDRCDLASDGSYTAVGTYDHRELLQLVGALSEETGVPGDDLVVAYGQHLFTRFAAGYPRMFQGLDSTFQMLARIEDYIHVEVRKLYPDAELPTLRFRESPPGRAELLYRSRRPFGKFAEGLIAGCAEHFGEEITIEPHDESTQQETIIRFELTCLKPTNQPNPSTCA